MTNEEKAVEKDPLFNRNPSAAFVIGTALVMALAMVGLIYTIISIVD